ncbi:MAG: hypothetical protein SOT13_06190 [Candidatus Aphodousia sp.]|nr:hypothetical protein [Sutterella sp.]MDY2900097.1 hypothetical protein [Candidatus Aphodousia sp.]
MHKLTPLALSLVVALVATTASAADVPHRAKPIENVNTFEVFQDGIYHFWEQNRSEFKVGKKAGKTAYRMNNTFSKDTPHLFSYGGSRNWVVKSGTLTKPPVPNTLHVLSGNKVSLVRRGNASGTTVELKAYDVSGKPIADFLRSHNDQLTKTAQTIGSGYRFAKGSVAYMPVMQSLRTELVVPEMNVFTGQKTINGFIKTFSGKVPTCLRYEKRAGSQPYAIRFADQKSNSGTIEIFEAKRGKVFCEVDGPSIAKGSYKVTTVNGTRVMTLKFPKKIDPRDVGIRLNESKAFDLAFIEVKKPKASVLPGRIVYAKEDFTDNQYRFNAVAAQSIDKALKR